MRTGDLVNFAIRLAAEQAVELEAENWRLCSTTLVRGVAVELEAENWRRCSLTMEVITSEIG